MVFTSISFIYYFLPLLLICYFVVPKKFRNIILLMFSVLFYFYGEPKYILLMLIEVLISYVVGLLIDKYKSKNILIIGIFIHVLLFGIFKYFNFVIINVNNLFHSNLNLLNVVLPIGISFYTLQGLSYIFDVYKGKIDADFNLGRLALFMSFFPCIMEGPICRYSDTAIKLYEGEDLTYKNLAFGSQRILWGLFKKMIIADRLNPFIEKIFCEYNSLDGGVILLGAIFYTIQLYADFSGTIDVVIGSGELFGISLPENFRQPFFSKNISDFWTRWHITLGTWFRDYIFYPVSLSKPMKKMTLNLRKILGNHFGPLVAGSVALLCVWLSNGLWHGAAWTYVFFGIYHFILIVLGNIFTPLIINICKRWHITRTSKPYVFMQIIKTSILVVFGELFFRATTLSSGFIMFKKIFTDFSFNSLKTGSISVSSADGTRRRITAARCAPGSLPIPLWS